MASQLIAVSYPDMFKAEEVRLTLMKLQRAHLVDLEDAVVVTKDAEGKVKLNQINNLPVRGAVAGSFWGMLIGLIFLNPLLGAVIGASSGAVSGALSDIGINDDFMKELGATLCPGTSALFVLVRSITLDKVLPEIEPFGGKILQTSLSNEDEASLQAALNKIHQS